jgi:hypothetical protein
MRKFWTASVAAMAFTFMTAPASAQQPWSVSGEITNDDAGGTGPHYDNHTIRLEAGTRYRISVDSTAFDAVARLYRQGSDEPVAENDDGDGLNPRLNYTPTESGDYTLRVVGFAAEGRGAYTASLATLPPLPPGQPVPWSTNGRIDNDDARDGAEGAHYDEYALHLEAGHRYTIKVESTAFDTMARLYRAGEDNTVAENDDGGDGTNSRISFVPETTGDYTLRVSPLANDGHGAYRASAEMAPPLPAPLTQFQRMSAMTFRVYEGALTNSDGEGGSNGARVDDYLVRFDRNQERLIMLDSPDGAFDTVVQVLHANNREAEPLASNDDSGGTLNSLLQFKAEEAGDYIVRVTSFATNGRGRYRLRVSE